MSRCDNLTGAACLVTGVAGFIGSHLAEALLARGCAVMGVDMFTNYYSRDAKEANLADLRVSRAFNFIEADLSAVDLRPILAGIAYVFHQAGQPGVRSSWGEEFPTYLRHNVLVSQRLLEAARQASVRRFIYASSSSVYGNAPDLPIRETTLPGPISPYGVTKLAAEHLTLLYATNFNLPTVSLRYFSVFGPRQRPDMAFHRFIRSLVTGLPLEVNGDGHQTRDFTFVSDIVQANLAAATAPLSVVQGRTYNIGGGSRVSVNSVINELSDIAGMQPSVSHRQAQSGDARHTLADYSAAAADLGYTPRVGLRQGLQAEWDWLLAVTEESDRRSAPADASPQQSEERQPVPRPMRRTRYSQQGSD